MATFAQPPIIGLAYNYRLELFITNAADQEFRQQCQSNMILYSNQPNSSVIFKNLEHYENEFAKEFIINQQLPPNCGGGDAKASRSLSIPNASITPRKLSPQEMSNEPSPIEGKKMNIETYLLSIIKASHFNDRMNTSGGRLSSTTASESDECELFSIQSSLGNSAAAQLLKRLSTSSTASEDMVLPRFDDNNNNGDDSFSNFLKFNTPLKNNFMNNRLLTPETVETSFVWHMGFGNSGEDGVLHNYDYILKENGSIEDDEDEDDDITDFDNNFHSKSSLVVKSYVNDENGSNSEVADDSFEKKLDNLTLGDRENNNSEDSDLEKFNSHQYWYIAPPNVDFDQNELNNNSIKEEDEINHNDSTIIMSDETESIDSMKISNTNASDKMEVFNETPPDPNALQNPEINPEEIEWNLIEDFVYMKDIDNTLCFKCAYNFPAVMLTLGRKFWPLLHQHFLSLCNDLQSNVRVRKTMAKSIYQIALIIGSEQATKDLVAPFVEFFKDIEEIKIEVVKQVSNFIKIIDPSKHELIVNQLEMCWLPTINVVNWRLREEIGIQIVELNKFVQRVQKENCVLYLTGLALKLMMDKYDCVRKVGIDAVRDFICSLNIFY